MVLHKVSRLLKKLGSLRHPPTDTLEMWAARHKRFVEDDVRKVLPFIPDGGRFVDIGANVGLFTECLIAERPAIHATLFEPVERYWQACCDRFAGNGNVEIHRLGVGNEAGPVTIYKAAHNYGANSVMEDIMFDRRENSEVCEDTVIESEEIEVVVFSEFARQNNMAGVDLIKTDTEGYDFAVLEGMIPWLSEQERLPVIFSELLAKDYHPRWERQVAVVEQLTALGYQPIDLSALAKIDDVLFLPVGHPAAGA